MTDKNRLPPLSQEQWSEEQRVLAEEVINGPRGALLPPFQVLLRSPELMSHAQRMGEYLRYRSAIGLRLSELAIILTARYWNQPVEWEIHAPIALQQGISEQAITAIRHRQEPQENSLKQDEWLVYHFCQQLHQQKQVSDEIWQQVISQFGETAVIDLTGINGYYSLLAMMMNVARTPTQSPAEDF
ncbi:carboxymuconolactone decarboxylase family protein [Tatumella citrea]|uniref:Carboxymuconolactone decarboxylase n=1 Tax=Tatumella citrea TaxID=53336 RepID=A0A1Y0L4B1_TATCI|nr:carboxymuconolactone decarboxylase family protein [Tatumella citrea]ARU92575.1 carboxymuconolactone decarboxylase [Tatumella citrea]ARU96610.1 carboxymuconolactone decarboxylase [Tatumella citrea]